MIAAVAPVGVVAAVVPAAYAEAGPRALPLLFLGTGALLLAFLSGATAMSGRLPHAGPLYCFIARGLGRPLGVGAGWLAVLSYQALQFALYGLVGAAAAPVLTVPWWAVALGCWLIVAGCGAVRVTVAVGLLFVLVAAEAVVLLGYSAADLLRPAGGRLSWATLAPANLAQVPRPVLGLLLVVVALTFVGFETAFGYAEEARVPRRSIAHAAYLATLLIALLLAAASWAMSVAAGPDRIAAVAGARGSELIFELAAARLPPGAVPIGRITLLAGLLAALIALQAAIARYLFALGRERVLPHGLARTGRRTSVPWVASLTQTVLAGLAIGGAALARLDPAATARVLAAGGALGILALLAGSALAVLIFLNRHPDGAGAWRRLLAPGLSTVALGTLGYLACGDLARLAGLPVRQALMVPGVAVTVLLCGAGYALVLRRLAPVSYAGLGLGGAALVVAPAAAPSQPAPRQREPGAHRPERVNRA
jgi:amino acid transporter